MENLLFLLYRKQYLSYYMYQPLLNMCSDLQKKILHEFVRKHNVRIRREKMIRDKVYLDTLMGSKIYLEEAQRDAIVSGAQAILIGAGAGSGKTTTILAKIKYMIEKEGVPPSSIALISYTNETVNELKEKLHNQLHYPVCIFTFHTFSLSLLSEKRKIVVDTKPILQNILNKMVENYYIKRGLYKIFARFFDGPSFLLPYISPSLYESFFYKKGESIWDPLLIYLENKIQSIRLGTVIYESTKEREFIQYLFEKYIEYMRKNKMIDFEGMIKEATHFLKYGECSSYYTHLFVDEYQDISYNRFLLIYEYVTKIRCNICVVGDDFQSIFAFSGSEISLFTDFTNYFKEAEVYTITKTYRNSQYLIDIAGKFIMKNKKQIHKNLLSDKKEHFPIYLWYYNNNKISVLEKCIEQLENGRIALLGRYQEDLSFILESSHFTKVGDEFIYNKRKELPLSFLTVHASKGLGFDSVILLNMESGKYGFPSERDRDGNEPVLYAEERRLFYVALTRTKGRIHMLVPRENSSSFIAEIVKENVGKIVSIRS